VKNRTELRSWFIVSVLGALAAALFLLNATLALPSGVHALAQSVAEALTVSIVVALVVEPRLLRHFGEQLASQTFWASFYSRAPREYRDAIQELASATQFAIAVNLKVVLDWADDDQAVIRCRFEHTSYRENRSSKPFPYEPRGTLYDSPFPAYKAEIDQYQVICESSTFHGRPLIDNFSRVEREKDGRLVVKSASKSYYFLVPPGLRYTTIFGGTTYTRASERFTFGISAPALSLTIELHGSALPDLWISIIHPSSGVLDAKLSADGSSLVGKGPIHMNEVSLSGSVIILYWARKQGVAPGREAEPDSNLKLRLGLRMTG
jgi:Ca2+/Na+ antiporter